MMRNTPIYVKEFQVIPIVLEMDYFDQKGLLKLCCVGSPPTRSLPVLGARTQGAPFLSYTKRSYTRLII